MRRKIFTVILVLLMFAVTSCGKAEINISELALKIVQEGIFAEELTEISSDVTLKRYGLDSKLVEECVSYAATMAFVDEVVIFKVNDVEAVEAAVNKHIEAQKENYASYAPDEVSKLSSCISYIQGDYVIVCVSMNSDKAGSIINEYINQ